jgi:hypothetical protein
MSELFDASIRVLRSEIVGKQGRVRASLEALKNQHGSYAEDHRDLLFVYDMILIVIPNARLKAGHPDHARYDEFCRIAKSWGYD